MCQYYTKKTDRRPYEKFADGKTVCIEDEIPFDLPNGWAWARIGDVFDLQAGKNIKADCIYEQASPGHPFACFGGNGIRGYVGSSNVQGIHAIIGRQGALCGNLNFSTEKFYATEHAVVVTTFANTEALFAFHFLKAMNLNRLATATAQPGLSVAIVNQNLMPIPPLAEQKRIVAKIKELFAETDKIAVAEDNLAYTAERINKKVLDLAMRGQLVPQDPNDEPAEELLNRIAEARQRNANKKSRRSKCEESVIFYGADRSAYETRNGKTVCIDDEIPFEIPVSWAWTRLGDIFQHNTGKALNRNSSGGEFKEYITTSNVYWDEFKLDTLKSMRFTEDELDKCTIKEGDLLVCEGGDIGRAAIWNLKREVCIQNHLHRLRPYMEICRSYFCFALRHYKYTNRLQGKGIGLQGFSSGMLHSLLIPFPPLAEQKRIVAKIEEVRKLTRSLTT